MSIIYVYIYHKQYERMQKKLLKQLKWPTSLIHTEQSIWRNSYRQALRICVTALERYYGIFLKVVFAEYIFPYINSIFAKIMFSSLLGAQCRKQHFKMYNSISGLTYVYVIFMAYFVHNSISSLYFWLIVCLEMKVGERSHKLEVSDLFCVMLSSYCRLFSL